MYNVVLTKAAAKDVQKLKAVHLSDTAKLLIEVIQNNPFQNPPPYEKLVGNLQGLYSRRINIKHRLVYEVIENEKIVKVVSMWSHYERV